MFYANKMFEEANPDTAKVMSFITMLLNFLSTFGSVFLADKLGRRSLLLYGSASCGVTLLGCMIGASGAGKDNTGMTWMFNIAVFLFIIAFEMSHGPVCWVYMSEILPTVWMGYGVAVSWVFTIAVSLSTPYFFNGISYWTYFLYFIFMVGVFF